MHFSSSHRSTELLFSWIFKRQIDCKKIKINADKKRIAEHVHDKSLGMHRSTGMGSLKYESKSRQFSDKSFCMSV